MRRGAWAALAVPVAITAAFALGTIVGNLTVPQTPVVRKVGEIDRIVRSLYPEELPPEKLERSAIDGLLRAVDLYSEYFTAEEWVEWQQRHMSGKFVGVGIHVEPDKETGYILITTPVEDSPAFAADILPGDMIVAVDGEDIQGRLLNDIVRRIKGEAGTKVRLTLHRKDRDRFDVELTRAEIKNQAVRHKMVDPEIGYVRISDFTEMLPDFDRATTELRKQGLKALVIDLRFNGGGLLQAAVDLCDRFLPPDRDVARSVGRSKSDERIYRTRDSKDLPEMPLVVLTNGATAYEPYVKVVATSRATGCSEVFTWAAPAVDTDGWLKGPVLPFGTYDVCVETRLPGTGTATRWKTLASVRNWYHKGIKSPDATPPVIDMGTGVSSTNGGKCA